MADDPCGPKRARAEEGPFERTPKQLKTDKPTEGTTTGVMPFTPRMGWGRNGRRVAARTIFYRLRMDKLDGVNIFQYEVNVKEQGSSEFEDDKLGLSKGIKLDVMKALENKLGTARFAFNPAPTLVSPFKLKDPESGTEVEEMSLIVDVPKPNEKRKRNFEVMLRLTREDNVRKVLDEYQRGGDGVVWNNLIHLLTSLNVVFHCEPLQRMDASRGPWHYTTMRSIEISRASEIYRAFTQSVKLAERGLVLNFNSGAAVFYKQMMLSAFLETLPINMRAFQTADENEAKKVNDLLVKLKLKVTFPHTHKEGKGKKRQPETVKGLAFDKAGRRLLCARDVTFFNKNGERLQSKLRYVAKEKNGGMRTETIDLDSVLLALSELHDKNPHKTTQVDKVREWFESLAKQEDGKVEIDDILHKICPPTRMTDYFRDTYNINLLPKVPIIWTGTKKKPSYHYLLHAQLAAGQRKNKVDSHETEQMILKTSEEPRQRLELIDGLKHQVARFDKDPVVEAFKLELSRDMIVVDDARILEPPRIETTPGQFVRFQKRGEWDHRFTSLFCPVEELVAWGILVTDPFFIQADVDSFCKQMQTVCREKGIKMTQPHVKFVTNTRDLEGDLKRFVQDVSRNDKSARLIIVFKGPDNDSVRYSEIKRVCDCELGIPTTCVNSRKETTIFKPFYVKGIVFKINAKLGGYRCRDTTLKASVNWRVHLPFPDRTKTMVVGIDVSHPAPGSRQPSVFAITALMDPWGHRYRSRYRAQSRRVEVGTTDMEDMIEGLIEDFEQCTDGLPNAILVYRDGVSESQFQQVLATEVQAFRNVAAKLAAAHDQADVMPSITYIVAQKRNHARFFPTNDRDASGNGNFDAGLVVDTAIVNPRMFDFHLLSHAGLQGTSRPVYYHVLLNEGRYTADDIQALTYALCYGYSRCTKSVGCVAPIYYADRVAERVRLYYGGDWDDLMPDTGTVQSNVSGGSDRQPETKIIHKNLRNTMFFI